MQDALIKQLEELVKEVIAANPDYFLVEVRIKPTNNVKVFLDADHGAVISDMARYNRSLYAAIEEKNLFPTGDFSLEVSSAGLDEPLKLHRQYVKNTGRPVEVMLKEGIKLEGKLLHISDQGIVIESTTGKGKKAVTVQNEILFDNIKTTKIQIVF
jgi:ribosome maturation factor RimP